jgi:hypothetical protein
MGMYRSRCTVNSPLGLLMPSTQTIYTCCLAPCTG